MEIGYNKYTIKKEKMSNTPLFLFFYFDNWILLPSNFMGLFIYKFTHCRIPEQSLCRSHCRKFQLAFLPRSGEDC